MVSSVWLVKLVNQTQKKADEPRQNGMGKSHVIFDSSENLPPCINDAVLEALDCFFLLLPLTHQVCVSKRPLRKEEQYSDRTEVHFSSVQLRHLRLGIHMAVSFEELPNEVLYQIFLSIPPSSAPTLQQVSRRFNGVSKPLLWRHHCRTLFKYWSPEHQMRDKFNSDVDKVDWKAIFSERHNLERRIGRGIDSILSEQKGRLPKAEDIVDSGYDAKDALLRNLNVEESTDDVLARRFYSDAVLGMVHRTQAIREWMKLAEGKYVPLERALAGFDMFVLHGRHGDFDNVSAGLDRIADVFRRENPEYEEMTSRRKATAVAEHLRAQNLVGIKGDVDANYHNMQNNFIGIALQDDNHPSLPLISVALYCCVVQRLGLDAHPCGFPFHALAIVKPPKDFTIDGQNLLDGELGQPIYMDPFRSSSETGVGDLTSQLVSLGIAAADHAQYLDSASSADIVRRSAKNIITSVQTLPRSNASHHLSTVETFPEMDGAFYAALWALIILADSNSTTANTQRAQFLPYIVQRVETHHPMDVSLIEKYIAPLFSDLAQQDEILETIRSMREDDSRPKEVKRRTREVAKTVRYKIGQHFRHHRYNYFAVITGWDVECLAGEVWISRMRVNELSRGKHQSFYHVR